MIYGGATLVSFLYRKFNRLIHAGRELRCNKRTKIKMTEKEDVVIFCDLSISRVVKCDDVVEQQTWVDKQFDLLAGRIGQ